jgi:hypothetical protein
VRVQDHRPQLAEADRAEDAEVAPHTATAVHDLGRLPSTSASSTPGPTVCCSTPRRGCRTGTSSTPKGNRCGGAQGQAPGRHHVA